jgi:pseudouridine kinase
MRKIVVIGASAIDILGQTQNHPIAHDSNPGRIEITVGGVGHNIALVLAALGMQVDLVSPLADDEFGKIIGSLLKDAPFRFHPLRKNKGKTPIYLAACDDRGVLELGINDFSLLDRFNSEDLTIISNVLVNADALVLDANLPQKLIAFLLEVKPLIPVYCDGVSQKKVLRFKPYLDNISAIKVNRKELLSLYGLKASTDDTEISKLISGEEASFIVTNGSEPLIYNDNGKIASEKPKTPMKYLTSTGAGDALFAGYIHAIESGLSKDEAIRRGLQLARMTFENGLAKLGQLPLDHILEEECARNGQ